MEDLGDQKSILSGYDIDKYMIERMDLEYMDSRILLRSWYFLGRLSNWRHIELVTHEEPEA